MRILLIVVICNLFFGCAIAPLGKTAIRQTPIEITNKSKSISVSTLVDGVEKNHVIGKAYSGNGCFPNGELLWFGNERRLTDVSNLLRNKLDKSGYSLVGKSYSPFNEEYSKQAALLLGGRITEIYSNACYGLNGAKGEVFVKVEWEVYDTQNKSIIFSVTSEGYSSSIEFIKYGDKELYDKAFDMAIDNLLADKSFYNLLTSN